MSAPHRSSACQPRQLRGLLAGVLVAAGCFATSRAIAAREEPVTAVYKAYEISFVYRSSALAYPCYELENRVASILIAAGARDDIEAKTIDCRQGLPTDPSLDQSTRWDRSNRWGRSGESWRLRRPGDDREQVAHLRIRALTPVEMTPQVLAEVEKDKARRDLVSRVTGNMAAALNDPIVFEAQRQQVTLSHRPPLRLEPEDCELLEQMTTQVFPKLGMRVVRRSSSCNPRELSNIPPQLVVEALLPTGALRPMPEPEKKRDAPAPAPAAEGEPPPANETSPQ